MGTAVTPNLNLIKPDGVELASNFDTQHASNMDILDAEIQALKTGHANGIQKRVATVVRTTTTSFINTTETVIATLTFSAFTGKIYKLTADWGMDFTDANDEFAIRFREDSVSGNQLQSKRIDPEGSINDHNPWHVETEFTAAATASKSIVATLVRLSGVGSAVVNGSVSQPSFTYADYVRG